MNTIASFGALTSSTIMTCRQFLVSVLSCPTFRCLNRRLMTRAPLHQSILINAGAFGNFASVGTQGWFGVGLVASGIFIKMDPRYREQKPSLAARNADIARSDITMLGRKSHGDEKIVFDADEEAKEGLLPRVAVTPGPPSTPVSPYPTSPMLKYTNEVEDEEHCRESRKVKNMRRKPFCPSRHLSSRRSTHLLGRQCSNNTVFPSWFRLYSPS